MRLTSKFFRSAARAEAPVTGRHRRELRADDLARLITHLDAGPAAVLGSSGDAVSVLALARTHPEPAHTVIAHESPSDQLVPDREDLLRRTDEMVATYLAGDRVGAWRRFMAIANIHRPDELVEHVFGGERSPQDLAEERFQYEHMLRPTVRWVPDLDALRTASTRVVVGIGEDSGGELCERTSLALASGLGVEPTRFPGGHFGFVDAPDRFVVRLREVLSEAEPGLRTEPPATVGASLSPGGVRVWPEV